MRNSGTNTVPISLFPGRRRGKKTEEEEKEKIHINGDEGVQHLTTDDIMNTYTFPITYYYPIESLQQLCGGGTT